MFSLSTCSLPWRRCLEAAVVICPAQMKRYFDTGANNRPSESKVAPVVSKVAPAKRKKKGKPKPKAKGHDDSGPQGSHPGRAPVDERKAAKYKRTSHMSLSGIKTKQKRQTIRAQNKKVRKSVLQAARAELLLPEDVGYLEADDGEQTHRFFQRDIAEAVDITSATKYFDLSLPQYGPYSINYSRDSRHLLLGGHRGHVAALDWVTKHLLCETNVMESVHDVQWLHMPTMYAVAQKSWTYIYDNQGVELHCLKTMDNILKMTFLPYHFLLAAASEKGFLSWLDVSVGKMVAQFSAKSGRLNVMEQNPYNAILLTGHTNGVVKMWSPNIREPVVSMLCSKAPIRDIAVDHRGLYLATASADRTLNIWDVRTYKCLNSYTLKAIPGHVTFSQRELLAISVGNFVEVYRNCCRTSTTSPYLRHKAPSTVSALEFCPYEDVLGIGHQRGFSSILVPGSGEPNFDALESNPYMTKSQRREMEVKALLDKVQPDLICLDPRMLGKVDTEAMQTRVEANSKKLWVKPKKIDYSPRVGKLSKSMKVKKMLKDERLKKHLQKLKKKEGKESRTTKVNKKPRDVLDRFKPK